MNAVMPITLWKSFVRFGRIFVKLLNSYDHKAATPFISPITSIINEIKPVETKQTKKKKENEIQNIRSLNLLSIIIIIFGLVNLPVIECIVWKCVGRPQ